MASMENPTKSFRQIITIVDDTGTVSDDYLSFITPFLIGKILDVDVVRTSCGSVFVDHCNHGVGPGRSTSSSSRT